LYRGINDFKKGYQPRTILVKDYKGGLFADSHSILARWRNYFSQIRNVHGVNDGKQTEIHTAEPLVPESSASEAELVIEELKSHKSPGIDQIPAELFQAECKTFGCEIHKLIISIWNEEKLHEDWKESIILPIYKKGDKTDCSNYKDISILPTTCKMLSNILLSILTPYAEEIIVIINVDFDVAGQLLIIYSAFVKYLRKNCNKMKQCISSLYTSRSLMVQLEGRSCLIFSLRLVSP